MLLIEAGACGKPAIGTSFGGIPLVISDKKTGLLIPSKDSKTLAKAIKTLKDPKLSKKMGENGYKKVKENFTWEKQIKKTNDLFGDII